MTVAETCWRRESLLRAVLSLECSTARRRSIPLPAQMSRQSAEWIAGVCAPLNPGGCAVVFGEALWQLTQFPARSFEELDDQVRRQKRREIWAAGALADQVRARLGGASDDLVMIEIVFDIARMTDVVCIECGRRDAAFEAYRLDDLTPVRDWLNGATA